MKLLGANFELITTNSVTVLAADCAESVLILATDTHLKVLKVQENAF